MKRLTISLLVTALILILGGTLIWLLLVAPRLQPTMPGGPTGSTTSTEPGATAPDRARNSALNLYLASPANLPNGAVRAELTLVKAVIESVTGEKVVFFEGVQRVTMQPGVVEKALSERIPDGTWNRLTLTFSPAAELVSADGQITATLLGRKDATFAFNAEVPISRSLALFGVLPMEQGTVAAEQAVVANVSSAPTTAEWFVFGGFLLDPRGRGDIYMQESPTLVSVIKEDLGFDISIAMQGSSGFQPVTGQPAPPAPVER